MKMKFYTSIRNIGMFCLGLLILGACKKNIPTDQDSLGEDIVYNTKEFTPVLGRNTFYSNIVSIGQNTSQPLSFKIVNVRDLDGEPATVFNDKFPVKVWKEAYTGLEKSIAEIEAKRKIEYRPLLEILEHSGNINFWGQSARSAFVKAQPDSGYVFDIEVSNTGGRRYLRNFKLKPFREQPYEPSIEDPITGSSSYPYTNAIVSNMIGERTGRPLGSADIRVYMNKTENTGKGTKTLTISFLDSLNNPIDPAKFNETDWPKLVHGFNPRVVDKKVVYDVAYPIPLARVETAYTLANGTAAYLVFGYRRKGNLGYLELGAFAIPFAIYEEGDWEIQFRFPHEAPKFD